jgi:predicted Fe-S protein YdhL (DUF1289 family)
MTQIFAPLRVESPCIKVCVLDGEQVCVGCGRHIDEIATWSQMTPVQRHESNVRAQARRSRRESEPGAVASAGFSTVSR